MLNTALWIAQGLVAVAVLSAGVTKLALPREKLAQKMHWAAAWPRGRIKALGAAEVAGALGLVLPLATGIAPMLTPIAAVCVAILMIGAIGTHRRLGEGFGAALVIGLLSAVIAAGRISTVRTQAHQAPVATTAQA